MCKKVEVKKNKSFNSELKFISIFFKQMFEDKFAKLPEEPAIINFDIDPSSSTTRNNGLLSQTSARKRKRHSSKHNSSAGGHTSSMVTSSDDGVSSDESSDDIENNRENTLRQLYSLQEQVKKKRIFQYLNSIFQLILSGESYW